MHARNNFSKLRQLCLCYRANREIKKYIRFAWFKLKQIYFVMESTEDIGATAAAAYVRPALREIHSNESKPNSGLITKATPPNKPLLQQQPLSPFDSAFNSSNYNNILVGGADIGSGASGLDFIKLNDEENTLDTNNSYSERKKLNPFVGLPVDSANVVPVLPQVAPNLGVSSDLKNPQANTPISALADELAGALILNRTINKDEVKKNIWFANEVDTGASSDNETFVECQSYPSTNMSTTLDHTGEEFTFASALNSNNNTATNALLESVATIVNDHDDVLVAAAQGESVPSIATIDSNLLPPPPIQWNDLVSSVSELTGYGNDLENFHAEHMLEESENRCHISAAQLPPRRTEEICTNDDINQIMANATFGEAADLNVTFLDNDIGYSTNTTVEADQLLYGNANETEETAAAAAKFKVSLENISEFEATTSDSVGHNAAAAEINPTVDDSTFDSQLTVGPSISLASAACIESNAAAAGRTTLVVDGITFDSQMTVEASTSLSSIASIESNADAPTGITPVNDGNTFDSQLTVEASTSLSSVAYIESNDAAAARTTPVADDNSFDSQCSSHSLDLNKSVVLPTNNSATMSSELLIQDNSVDSASDAINGNLNVTQDMARVVGQQLPQIEISSTESPTNSSLFAPLTAEESLSSSVGSMKSENELTSPAAISPISSSTLSSLAFPVKGTTDEVHFPKTPDTGNSMNLTSEAAAGMHANLAPQSFFELNTNASDGGEEQLKNEAASVGPLHLERKVPESSLKLDIQPNLNETINVPTDVVISPHPITSESSRSNLHEFSTSSNSSSHDRNHEKRSSTTTSMNSTFGTNSDSLNTTTTANSDPLNGTFVRDSTVAIADDNHHRTRSLSASPTITIKINRQTINVDEILPMESESLNESVEPMDVDETQSPVVQKSATPPPPPRDENKQFPTSSSTLQLQSLSAKEMSKCDLRDEKDVFVEKYIRSPFDENTFQSPTLANTFDSSPSTIIGHANNLMASAKTEDFADEEFQNSNGLFLNPSDFDFLLTKGNNNVQIDRSSLLLRFDPLLGHAVPLNTSVGGNNSTNVISQVSVTSANTNINRLSPAIEEEEHHFQDNNRSIALESDNKSTDIQEEEEAEAAAASAKSSNSNSTPVNTSQGSVFPGSGSGSSSYEATGAGSGQQQKLQITARSVKKNAKMSVDVIQDIKIESDCKSIENHNSQSDEKQNFKMDELEKKIRNEVLKTEDIEKKLKEAEQREEALIKRITEKDKTINKMNGVIEAYEKAIAELIAEKEQIIQNYEKQLAEVKADRDSNYHHLTSLETTFSDLHVKYEKSKEMTAQLKNSEEALLAEKRQNLENLRLQEQRYEKMKNHAMQQLEIANKKLETLTRNHAMESTKLKALLKKEEISRASINEQLQQKSRENEELVKICDELISGQGS